MIDYTTPFLAPKYKEERTQLDFSDKVALLDADKWKHLACIKMHSEIEIGKKHSKKRLHEIVNEYLEKDVFERFKAKSYVFCFSAPRAKTFRNGMAQEKKYKGNRDNTEDKQYYIEKYDDMAEVYTYIRSRYTVLLYDDIEADDLLSMLQLPDKTFIYSTDKDLKQVPGFHYNIKLHLLELTTPEEGISLLIKQVLKGDVVDNFGGLKGFGEKALEKFEEETEGQSPQLLLFQAIQKFIDKFGLTDGIDTFVEMWSIASMKINRGAYLQEKYASAFMTVKGLTDD